MEYIISLFWAGLQLIGIVLFVAAFLPQKRSKKASLLPLIVTWLLMYGYSNMSINQVIIQILSISVTVCLSLCLFDGSWFTHILLSTTGYIFIAITNTIVIYGTSAFLGISVEAFVWRKAFYVTVVTLGMLLDVFLAWLLFCFRGANRLQRIQSKWLLLTIMFPVVSVMILISVFFNYQDNEDLPGQAVFMSAVLAIANIGILYIVNTMEKATMREQEVIVLRKQMDFQAESITALESSYRHQRKVTHEFEHHLQALQNLLEQQEYSTANDYLQQLRKDRSLRMFCVNSHHPIADAILNQKYQTAQENGIQMHIQVNDLSHITVPTKMLVVLLSNLLDNAIEACQKLSDGREIHCSILDDEALYISIRNTSPAVKITDDGISTSKSETKEHGYGIPAIRYVLEQLHAEYTFHYSDGWFQFVAEIPPMETE